MSPVQATIWLTSMILAVLLTLGGGTLWIFKVSNAERPRTKA